MLMPFFDPPQYMSERAKWDVPAVEAEQQTPTRYNPLQRSHDSFSRDIVAGFRQPSGVALGPRPPWERSQKVSERLTTPNPASSDAATDQRDLCQRASKSLADLHPCMPPLPSS